MVKHSCLPTCHFGLAGNETQCTTVWPPTKLAWLERNDFFLSLFSPKQVGKKKYELFIDCSQRRLLLKGLTDGRQAKNVRRWSGGVTLVLHNAQPSDCYSLKSEK